MAGRPKLQPGELGSVAIDQVHATGPTTNPSRNSAPGNRHGRATGGHSSPACELGGHANNVTKAKQLAAALALELDKRQNHGAPTHPRIVVRIDDNDILAPGANNPLESLLPYLPSARDLILNVILTRPVAGSVPRPQRAQSRYRRAGLHPMRTAPDPDRP